MRDTVNIKVPRPILDHYASLISCNHISKGKVPEKHLLRVQGKAMIMTGGAGTGNGGWQYVNGIQVVQIQLYKGKLNPESYLDHFDLVKNQVRERCYNGLLTFIGKRSYVLFGPEYHFEPVEIGIQTELF